MESPSLSPERRGWNAIPEFYIRTFRELFAVLSAGNFPPALPFRAEHKGRGGEFAFLPFLNPAIRWEFPGWEEQERRLFAGREKMKQRFLEYMFNFHAFQAALS